MSLCVRPLIKIKFHYNLYVTSKIPRRPALPLEFSTSSLTMEVEAVTHTLRWIASGGDSQLPMLSSFTLIN